MDSDHREIGPVAYNADGQLVKVLSEKQAEEIIEYRKQRIDEVEKMIINCPLSRV